MSAILVFESPGDLSHLVASAFVFHKVSAHHQFANGTYFTTSALVLKFSAFSLLSRQVSLRSTKTTIVSEKAVRPKIAPFLFKDSCGKQRTFCSQKG